MKLLEIEPMCSYLSDRQLQGPWLGLLYTNMTISLLNLSLFPAKAKMPKVQLNCLGAWEKLVDISYSITRGGGFHLGGLSLLSFPPSSRLGSYSAGHAAPKPDCSASPDSPC